MNNDLLELISEQGWDTAKCAVDMNNIIVGTNTTYFCTYENRKYVLRIGSLNSGLLSINRNAEEQTIRIMSDIGCTPKLHYFNAVNGNMITEFIEGSMASDEDFNDDSFTDSLILNMKKMHSHTIDYDFNPYLDIEQRLCHIEKNNIPLHKDFNSFYKKYLNIKNEYPIPDNTYRGLCHNDLFPENIIISNDKFWIIDFEYSGMGDIFFDFAVFIGHKPEDIQKAILKKYFGRCDDKMLRRLRAFTYTHTLWNSTWGYLKSLEADKSIFDGVACGNMWMEILNDIEI